MKTVATVVLIAFALVACAAGGGGLTDTGTGAVAGGVGGAILGWQGC
jgi:hypothetical protein